MDVPDHKFFSVQVIKTDTVLSQIFQVKMGQELSEDNLSTVFKLFLTQLVYSVNFQSVSSGTCLILCTRLVP